MVHHLHSSDSSLSRDGGEVSGAARACVLNALSSRQAHNRVLGLAWHIWPKVQIGSSLRESRARDDGVVPRRLQMSLRNHTDRRKYSRRSLADEHTLAKRNERQQGRRCHHYRSSVRPGCRGSATENGVGVGKLCRGQDAHAAGLVGCARSNKVQGKSRQRTARTPGHKMLQSR